MLGEYGVLAPGGARVVVERLLDLAEGQALPEEVPSDPILLHVVPLVTYVRVCNDRTVTCRSQDLLRTSSSHASCHTSGTVMIACRSQLRSCCYVAMGYML